MYSSAGSSVKDDRREKMRPLARGRKYVVRQAIRSRLQGGRY